MTARRTRRDAKSDKGTRTKSDRAPAEDAAEEALPFEAGLERLETLVEELEGGELELERALATFEEGVKLSRGLDRQLNRAEARVEVLLRQDGRFSTEALDSEPDAPDEEST